MEQNLQYHKLKFNPSICNLLELVRYIVGVKDRLPFGVKGLERSRELIIFITSSFSFYEIDDAIPYIIIPLVTAFPSTRLGALTSLFLERPPVSHGLFGREIFVKNRSVDLYDMRITRKERHLWRHSGRAGKIKERCAQIDNIFYLKKLFPGKYLFSGLNGIQIHIFNGGRFYPYILKILGLHRYFKNINTLQLVLEFLRKEKIKQKRISFILLDSYSSRNANDSDSKWRDKLISAFMDIDKKDAVKMMISLNGSEKSELTIPFTQGEIKYFMEKKMLFALNSRIGFVKGNNQQALELLKEKIYGRAELRDFAYLRKMGFKDNYELNGRFGDLLILPHEGYVLTYEEIPPIFSEGGVTQREMTVPLIIKGRD